MKRKLIAFTAVILTFAMLFTACSIGETRIYEEGSITAENAEENLGKFNIEIRETELIKGEVPEFEPLDSQEESFGFMYEMPSISNYPLAVNGNAEVDIEIFVPQEDNGSSILDFVIYAANKFNKSGYRLDSGESVSVSVRSLEASLAEDYILSGSYYPEGYIAANEIYGSLMEVNGIKVSMVTERTVGNTVGLIMQNEKYHEYGTTPDIATIVKATTDGEISVGYANPTNNPTGLNFVVSMLSYFDANNPMSIEATTDFSNFQNAVQLVAYSNAQMINAVQSGTVDAFVLERQAYENDEVLKNSFTFIPFGVRHDNPLYAIGELTANEEQTLKLFGKFLQNADIQKYGTSLGFNQEDSYVSTVSEYSGNVISTILEFWKNEKASGKQIVAFFIADKSGSMKGKNLKALKASLKSAMQYISEDCKVGLLSYNEQVYLDLPLGDFDRTQQEYFVGAIDSWNAYNGTATNNAILAAIKLINEEMKVHSDIKPIIILLSDGYTCNGYSLSSMKELIEFYNIPIYTIGYEADVEELEKIAAINGGAYIDANSDDIGYVLKSLFDAEM